MPLCDDEDVNVVQQMILAEAKVYDKVMCASGEGNTVLLRSYFLDNW